MENNIQNNQKRFAKYFISKWWFVCSILLGLICISDNTAWGVAFLSVGIAGLCYLCVLDPVTDEEFDKMFQEELNMVKKVALKKLNIDSSEMVAGQEMIYAPRLYKLGGANPKYKKGKDGIARYTPVDVIIFIFTKKQIASYQCCLDLLTRKYLNESTDEFFYQDIVSVATNTETIEKTDLSKLDKKIKDMVSSKFSLNIKLWLDLLTQTNDVQKFKLTSSGGNSISINLSNSFIEKKYGNTNRSQDMAERVIQVIRKLVRDKKS